MSDKVPQPDLNKLPIRIKGGKKFKKYPSIFGAMGLHELVQVARDHGMVLICGCKPDMHCRAEIGLYGTPEMMALVEDIWEAAGNDKKKPGERGVFGVNLDIAQEDWVDVQQAAAIRTKLDFDVTAAWKFKLNHAGGEVDAPAGWRRVTKEEGAAPGDYGYNKALQVWHPMKAKDIEYCGAQGIIDRSYGIIRKVA